MPDEFSDGPVRGGAPWLAWKECAWDGFVQWPFFFPAHSNAVHNALV